MRLPGFSVCLQAQAGIMPLKGKCIPRVQRVVLIIFLSLATLAQHQPFQNRTIPYLALNSPHLSLRTNPSKTALSHSLFVGEWACPSRCIDPLHPHNPRKRTIIPRPAPPHLPPLSKGGGLTARHKLLLCCVLLAIYPLFLYCKLFCRQDGGIASVASTLSIPTTIAKRQ